MSLSKYLLGSPKGWSPELATLYVDIGLAQHLQEVQSGVFIVLPGGTYVHVLMYADDLLTANLSNVG